MADLIKTPPAAAPADPAADALAGTTVGRFAISKRLGAGGMGQVYGAEDTTLKRFVAIKRMAPQANSSDADRKRLLKEAQRASALNHPNLGAIYDVVEHAGELWLVMEYIEGETLRRRLKQPISREEFFTIATQCCEGLQAAHEKGIIHGDIKPENIMLTPGNRVKILDFGVARRAWSAASPDDATKSMQTMTATGGTPAYMAPEVLLQQRDDGRSDLFSIGLVFYEMLGGDQPFQSDSLATTVARIVHVEPPPLKNVPGPLAGVVSRAIAKNPDARYANAAALLEDLRRVQEGGKPKRAPLAGAYQQYRALAALAIVLVVVAGLLAYRPVRQLFRSSTAINAAPSSAGGLPQTKILAVLPFTAAANADPKIAALGDGLVESIAAKLGKLTEDRAFEVVPPGNLQEKKISTLPDAARMFGANLGLALTIEPQSPEIIKVTYSVLSTQTGKPVGSGSLTVPTTDAFSVEQVIADGAVKSLQLQLRPEEEAALKYHGTDKAEAYEYYLQAQGYLLDHSKAENLDNAALMARAALKLDPNFGMAKAVLGESNWLKYSDTKQKQWIAPAQSDCNDAVRLGNAGAAGHVCLGLIGDGTGHAPEAAAEFQLALGLEPTNEDAAIGLALAYEHEGKITEAEKAYQLAIQAHPNSRYSYNMFGTFYKRRDEYEKALQMYARVIQIAPEWYGTYVNVGSIYDEIGQFEKAIDPLQKSIAIRPSYPGYVNLGATYFGLRRFDDAAKAYQEAIKLDPQQQVTWGNLGAALYYGGKKDESMVPNRKAAELALEELKVNPRDADLLSTVAGYYSMLGDRKKALLYLGQALQHGHNDKGILIDAAGVYNQLGDTGLAIEWLGKAVQAGYTKDKILSDPEFANLASNPSFQQLMKSK
ncbi:MAG TPA: protein kinase [Candidatus Dormibacteraeota bacterium]|nr:protein kinase [Candidatus Dormibacteraeota bacterium]